MEYKATNRAREQPIIHFVDFYWLADKGRVWFSKQFAKNSERTAGEQTE